VEVTSSHLLLVKVGNASQILRHESEVSVGDQLPRIASGGDIMWTSIVSKELITTTGGLYAPLLDAGGEPGDMVVGANGIAVPIYGNDARGHALYNPVEGRKLFKLWLRQWGSMIAHMPCLADVPIDGGSSFVVSLIKTFSSTHHPDRLSLDELDPNAFVCYVASHAAEFGHDLEVLISHCPELLNLKFNCNEVILP